MNQPLGPPSARAPAVTGSTEPPCAPAAVRPDTLVIVIAAALVFTIVLAVRARNQRK